LALLPREQGDIGNFWFEDDGLSPC